MHPNSVVANSIHRCNLGPFFVCFIFGTVAWDWSEIPLSFVSLHVARFEGDLGVGGGWNRAAVGGDCLSGATCDSPRQTDAWLGIDADLQLLRQLGRSLRPMALGWPFDAGISRHGHAAMKEEARNLPVTMRYRHGDGDEHGAMEVDSRGIVEPRLEMGRRWRRWERGGGRTMAGPPAPVATEFIGNRSKYWSDWSVSSMELRRD